MASFPQADGYRRIKRASRACQRCHSRKVRCDATLTGFPCTNFSLDTHPCQAFSGGRDRQKQLSLKRARALAERSAVAPQHAGPTPVLSKQNHGIETVDPAKISFLDAQGCLSLPNTFEVDVFIRHYFLYVHPFTLVLDEVAFWRAYRHSGKGGIEISLFLLRAIIFAASCFVPTEVASRCGYDSLLDTRDDLYQKAKLLYKSGIEKHSLIIARATLLLTYYSSDFEVNANSDWLRIAIRHAKTLKTNEPDMKRVWWSCLIRDRTISLGMRRPIQITAEDLEHYPQMLMAEDIDDEIFGSKVYKPEVKAALFELLTSLCHFVTAVTELVTVAYPVMDMAGIKDPNTALDALETAKSALLLWELDWMAYMEGRNFNLHTSIPLFSGLLSIYYQSARVALCNRVCLVLNKMVDYTTGYLQKLEYCRCELVAAISSIAEKVKQLITIKAIDKLPISVAAYTTTPYIVLSITSQSHPPRPCPDTAQNNEILVLFTAVNRSLGLRYPVTRISNLTSRAIWLSKLFKETPTPQRNTSYHHRDIFTLPLQQYTQLLQYIDHSMSIPRDSEQETNVLYAAASAPSLASISNETNGTGLELYSGSYSQGQRQNQGQGPEDTPIWMEAMENFFFGPGRVLSFGPVTDGAGAGAGTAGGALYGYAYRIGGARQPT
ncbi:hypothetical protein BDV12DRAFT_210583 [Aspergillus spectabilis]